MNMDFVISGTHRDEQKVPATSNSPITKFRSPSKEAVATWNGGPGRTGAVNSLQTGVTDSGSGNTEMGELAAC